MNALAHRGPDASGEWVSRDGGAALGHCRLSVLDLSDAGRQPMASRDGRLWIAYNGEVYNYLELRHELGGPGAFRTGTDTEVVLAAYERWGAACLERLIGMFAFAIWDAKDRTLFAARDRYGVKPLYICQHSNSGLWLASEIKALHAAGLPREPDAQTWATYLSRGLYDHSCATFWTGVRQLAPGHYLIWTPEAGLRERCWYDPAVVVSEAGEDGRSEESVGAELLDLLRESVKLRFRADVPVGVCLSGGLDSSLLFSLIQAICGSDCDTPAFTFTCNDPRYDETPWAKEVLADTAASWHVCTLSPNQVPDMAIEVARAQDEPFGGLPTLAMSLLHRHARQVGVTVLLDGNGLDEAWAGYAYYATAHTLDPSSGPVQGATAVVDSTRWLQPELARLADVPTFPAPFADPVRDLQYRDIRHAKLPRAMRFADRASMMHSRELREPFLDHRIVELGLRQPLDRRIRDGEGKWLPRRAAAGLVPAGLRTASKRPLQTPQREWLRGPLREWANDWIHAAIHARPDWLNGPEVLAAWNRYSSGEGDNSFPVWQWISVGLLCADGAAH